jgi:hypothetical protein
VNYFICIITLFLVGCNLKPSKASLGAAESLESLRCEQGVSKTKISHEVSDGTESIQACLAGKDADALRELLYLDEPIVVTDDHGELVLECDKSKANSYCLIRATKHRSERRSSYIQFSSSNIAAIFNDSRTYHNNNPSRDLTYKTMDQKFSMSCSVQVNRYRCVVGEGNEQPHSHDLNSAYQPGPTDANDSTGNKTQIFLNQLMTRSTESMVLNKKWHTVVLGVSEAKNDFTKTLYNGEYPFVQGDISKGSGDLSSSQQLLVIGGNCDYSAGQYLYNSDSPRPDRLTPGEICSYCLLFNSNLELQDTVDPLDSQKKVKSLLINGYDARKFAIGFTILKGGESIDGEYKTAELNMTTNDGRFTISCHVNHTVNVEDNVCRFYFR